MLRIVLAAVLTFAAAPALAQSIDVPIDQSRRVTLSGVAASIAVGNPAIADVTVMDGRNLLVTGKGYGVTSLLALDRNGRAILERRVVVSAPDEGRVSVYRGPNVQEYACGSVCERAPAAGSAPAQNP
jgi:Flp pilus assembly secretin CpaC